MQRYERWSDDDLALAFRAGDLGAGEALVQRYSRLVYSVALRHGASDTAAEDIFTEVWIKLQQQIGNYYQRAGFRAYLRSIVRSVTIDHLRREHRRESASLDTPVEDGDTTLGELLPAPEDLEQSLVDSECLDLVQRAVRELPERFREPLVLYYREGLSQGDIAERLGIPKNTVTTRIHRGREQVKRQVERWLAT